jgi:hypothetical protein
MSRCQRNHRDLPAPSTNVFRPDDGSLGVVATLDEDVRPKMPDELERRLLIEDDDHVDRLERGEDVAAITFAAHRAAGAFEAPDGRVAVDADDEGIAATTRSDENVDVAGM